MGQDRSSRKPSGVGLKWVSIFYLVWIAFESLVSGAPLLRATLLYLSPSSATFPTEVTLSGVAMPVAALLVFGWTLWALASGAGAVLGILSLTLPGRPSRLRSLVILGRTMFGLCVLSLVVSFVYGGAATFSGLYSSLLTGLLCLSLRRWADERARHGGGAADGGTPRKSFVASAVLDGGELDSMHSDPSRRSYRLLGGYATLMLLWGVLRALMGVSLLLGGSGFQEMQGFLGVVSSRPFEGLLLVAYGAYIFLVGRVGRRVLAGDSAGRTFRVMCLSGLLACAAAIVLALIALSMGGVSASQDLFYGIVDGLLYGAGLWCLHACSACDQ